MTSGIYTPADPAHKDQRTTSSIYSKPRPAHLIGAAEVVNFRRKA